MKTLYLTNSAENIYIDTETNEVGSLQTEDRYSIRGVYYIKEPMHVVYQAGEVKEELDAKKGDILLLFYSSRFNKYNIDTIRTKQWVANIKNQHEIEQKEKEEWAAKKIDLCDDCSEECEDTQVNTQNDSRSEAISKVVKKVLKKAKLVKKS